MKRRWRDRVVWSKKESIRKDGKMYKMQFEATENGNALYLFRESANIPVIMAEVEVPEGASEDYGYLTMKEAILAHKDQIPADIFESLVFQYDGQEQYLAADAAAECEVNLTIETEED